jgi:Domain of unknown function (DUF5658)
MSPLTVELQSQFFDPYVEARSVNSDVYEHADWSLFIILGIIQVLDGILTALGVTSFGTHAEGNVFIRHLMHVLGTIPALALVKSFSLIVIFSLAQLQYQVNWVNVAIRAVILLYLALAIIPWSLILVVHL